MSTRGQGHSLTFESGLSLYGNIQASPQKATESIVTKFHIEPPCLEEKKICSNRPGYMTNLTTTPYMVKTFKYLIFRNQWTDSLEKLGKEHWVLQNTSITQIMTWVNLDLFLRQR